MSFTSLNFHLVIGTKGRKHFLAQDTIRRLGAYISGLVTNRKGMLYCVGGYYEHIHVLLRLPPTVCVSDILRVIKSNSSRWLKEQHGIPDFAWQKRYWAFSVSIARIPELTGYIAKQEKHHSVKSFEDELTELHGHAASYLDEFGE